MGESSTAVGLSNYRFGADIVLPIPPDAHSFAGFRKWVLSDTVPEKLRIAYIHGTIYVDMSNESIQTHVAVKTEVYKTLPNLMDELDLGEFYSDGVLVSNEEAEVSNNPDGVAVLWETIESGRIRFNKRKDREIEIIGTPDWIMEVISDSSVAKDTRKLRRAYHKAEIPEYWLIDARGNDIDFQILLWRKSGYIAVPSKNGWQTSRVFGRGFRLRRERNRRGAWNYFLLVKPHEIVM